MQRPFTVLVAVLALLLISIVAWQRMRRDILPVLDLPTIYVAQTYGGLDPAQMEGYLVYFFEYHFLYLTGIEHVESKSIQGASLMKLQFHPGTDMAQAMAETVAFVNRARAFMPPGTMPPFITRFDPGSVPVGYLVFQSGTHSITEMQDAAVNRVRPLLCTLPGVSAPPPFGGNARTVLVNLKPDRLKSYRMSPDEVVQAIVAANVVSPSGNLKIEGRYPLAPVNAVPERIEELERAPVRGGEYPAVFVRDVAEVVDGSDIVTCYALVNGRRTVYVPITRRADASSLDVARAVKAHLADFQNVLPAGMRVSYELDRSPAIIRALAGVQWEALLGAFMAASVTIVFLGSWHSAIVVALNIPIALTAALTGLWLGGQTLNLMTLGGLALAAGILVDESIVCLENIHARAAAGMRFGPAALQGTVETNGPRLLAMLCIVILFTPALFMTGEIRAMFLPLALAVGLSVAASYCLSSTLVPVLAVWAIRAKLRSPPWFNRVRDRYLSLLRMLLAGRVLVVCVYFAGSLALLLLASRVIGSEVFPKVNAGELELRFRAPAGTDIDHTEAILQRALQIVESTVGRGNVECSLGFVGLHGSTYPINFLYLWNGGPEEGMLHVKLTNTHETSDAIETRLRKRFSDEIPEAEFFFEPADMVSQVMSFGSAAPIEVAVSGPNLTNDRAFAEKIKTKLEKIPFLRDVQFAQSLDYPTVEVAVDRVRSGVIGADMTDVSRALVPGTWSSRFQAPNFWADPRSGISYQVQTQIPQELTRSTEDLGDLAITERNGKAVLLRNVARLKGGVANSQFDRFDMQRTITLRANVSGAALSEAAGQAAAILREAGTPPRRVSVALRGQVAGLFELQHDLGRGFAVAIAAIVLLLLAYFQSWKLSAAVISVLPGVFGGVASALAITGTNLNLESFMGAIMALNVAVANAILLVTFAERARLAGTSAEGAALEGMRSRFRAIAMTSVAMLAGMLPIAFGLAEHTGQLAPLGRAVSGGLLGGTLCTLFVLPSIFALLQARTGRQGVSLYANGGAATQ